MDQGKSKRLTNKITVYGIVQGVGFRPLVYHVAKKYNIKGSVRNIGGLVEILAQSSEEEFSAFVQALKESPGGGEIITLDIEVILEEEFTDFRILESTVSDAPAIIPPDLPVCPECQKELYTVTDRRHRNPFISCMLCGPRYTILQKLPYDRHNTTMTDFEMCPSCHGEYVASDNRRFHAQTISCDDCGPYLIYHNNHDQRQAANSEHKNDKDINMQEAFAHAVKVINSGGIIAVKGIGGYHFVCSPFLEDTVVNLRRLKGREEKPFAVMFPNIDTVSQYCNISPEEKDLLEAKARPIVLLYLKHEDSMAASTNKESMYCGAFLPYTPLQLMLTKECGPLIMTSANISGKPIIKDDEEILSLQSQYLKGVLYNTRRIIRSVDDSVAKIINHKPQLIRRSRGYVPYPVFLQGGDHKEQRQIFAAGGDLKAAFCLYKKGYAYVSQYFGDLEEQSLMDSYQASVSDISGLLGLQPNLAVCDLHPNYYSSRFAKSLGLPILEVQHHHAHVASVIAEHDLMGKVIGVAFDGTGYGPDGNIWGGEFLVCEGSDYIRAGHISYTPILGGDASMKDSKKTAACYLLNNGLDDYVQDDRSNIIRAALSHSVNTILTSSMGRLFDAVASLLELSHENRYEGESAAQLEKAAVLALKEMEIAPELSFSISRINEIIEINPKPLLEKICRSKKEYSARALALGFHYAAAEAILDVCEEIRDRYETITVALSGGVFQNTILTERTVDLLKKKGFQVYINVSVPPNDGCISLGQAYIGLMD